MSVFPSSFFWKLISCLCFFHLCLTVLGLRALRRVVAVIEGCSPAVVGGLRCSGFSCCRVQARGLLRPQLCLRDSSGCGTWAWLLHGVVESSWTRVKPVPPALAGGVLTTGPPEVLFPFFFHLYLGVTYFLISGLSFLYFFYKYLCIFFSLFFLHEGSHVVMVNPIISLSSSFLICKMRKIIPLSFGFWYWFEIMKEKMLSKLYDGLYKATSSVSGFCPGKGLDLLDLVTQYPVFFCYCETVLGIKTKCFCCSSVSVFIIIIIIFFYQFSVWL